LHDQRNALDGEEEQEDTHPVQEVREAFLSREGRRVLCLRVRQVSKDKEVLLAVEVCHRQGEPHKVSAYWLLAGNRFLLKKYKACGTLIKHAFFGQAEALPEKQAS
jgi:hypothetical protein